MITNNRRFVFDTNVLISVFLFSQIKFLLSLVFFYGSYIFIKLLQTKYFNLPILYNSAENYG
jgi:hypothetical protein